MNIKEENKTISVVLYWLKNIGFTKKESEKLLKKYKEPLDQWLNEYLVTGSHLTPEDFAYEIREAENIQQLVNS